MRKMSMWMNSQVSTRPGQAFFTCGVSCFMTAAAGVCLAMLLLGGGGCEGQRKSRLADEEIQRYRLAHRPQRPDELLVSGERVTLDDVLSPAPDMDVSSPTLKEELLQRARQVPLEQFKREARGVLERRLSSNIVNIVLYKRALRELKGKIDEQQQEKAMEREMIRFTMEHGGNAAAADAALQEMGLSRERFKEYRKRQALVQYYIATKFPYNRPITHHDLLECYDQMKADNFFQPGVIQFRLIDVQITKVPLSGVDDDPVQVARSLAKEVMEKVQAGEDFAELAKKYSTGPRGATGGLWPPCDPEALAEPYDTLGEKAEDMEPGEVAGPIEAIDHVFLMKLEKKQKKGYRPLTEVQDVVEGRILADRRSAALKQLNEEFQQLDAGGGTDRFIDYCLESLYRQARAPAQAS
ncbi:MAG: peptidylprolyl isomerase [Sedimentisphaerales bacterium]|nr:peptidylprolyl isomerase [Sedimentisphaerales bacterium]